MQETGQIAEEQGNKFALTGLAPEVGSHDFPQGGQEAIQPLERHKGRIHQQNGAPGAAGVKPVWELPGAASTGLGNHIAAWQVCAPHTRCCTPYTACPGHQAGCRGQSTCWRCGTPMLAEAAARLARHTVPANTHRESQAGGSEWQPHHLVWLCQGQDLLQQVNRPCVLAMSDTPVH